MNSEYGICCNSNLMNLFTVACMKLRLKSFDDISVFFISLLFRHDSVDRSYLIIFGKFSGVFIVCCIIFLTVLNVI